MHCGNRRTEGTTPDALVLIAEFYSHLVVSNTTVYLIRQKAEQEFLAVPETKELLQADTRQFVLDDESGRSRILGTIALPESKPFLLLIRGSCL